MGRRASGAEPEIQREIEKRIEAGGFEVVDVEWGGSRSRPVVRVRIDLPGSSPGEGVTVDHCAHVSRALEAWLDEHPDVPERYVLEVSSPGVERPLRRRRDWTRFAGQRVVVRGHELLAGRAQRLEGELLGVVDDEAEGTHGNGEVDQHGYSIRLRLEGGDEVDVRREDIAGGNLLFEWE